MSTFAQFENQTLIQATLEMESALSVGSRLSLEPTGTDLPVVKGADGVPFIPGSSIKGVVRSYAERILRTVDRPPGLWACDPLDKASQCVSAETKEALWREAGENDERFAEMVWERTCTACRLFGSPWFAGRLAFKDAFLVNLDELPVATQIRDGVGIDRDLGAARTGVKYDYEVVVPGARFGVEILAENVDDWELGLLLAILQVWSSGNLPLGGKVTRGPGWGKLLAVRVRRVDRENLLGYLIEGKRPEVDSRRFLQAFQDHVAAVLRKGGSGENA